MIWDELVPCNGEYQCCATRSPSAMLWGAPLPFYGEDCCHVTGSTSAIP